MKKLSGPELLPKGPVKNVVIFLHGLGSNGADLLSLAPFMSGNLSDTAFLAPNAPLSMPQMAQAYQWFEYWDRTPMQILDGIKQSLPKLVAYIQDTCARFDLTPDKIILCGFSQGTMMALHVGLRMVEGLGGIIGFSGLMMSPETLMLEKVKKLPPVLLVHGLQDMVVPAAASFQAEMVLKTLGCDVRYIQRPALQHSIDDTGIKEAMKFCHRVWGENE